MKFIKINIDVPNVNKVIRYPALILQYVLKML